MIFLACGPVTTELKPVINTARLFSEVTGADDCSLIEQILYWTCGGRYNKARELLLVDLLTLSP